MVVLTGGGPAGQGAAPAPRSDPLLHDPSDDTAEASPPRGGSAAPGLADDPAPASTRLSPRSLRVRLASVRFPDACVACGRPPARRHAVAVTRGIDILFLTQVERRDVMVPVCRLHRTLRRLVGALAWFAALLLLPLTMAAARAVVDDRWVERIGGLLLAFAVYFTVQAIWVTPLLDGWLLGVRGAGLEADLASGRLRFGRAATADEVLRLTRAAELESEGPRP